MPVGSKVWQHEQNLKAQAKRKGLTGDQASAYVYGTLTKIKKAMQAKGENPDAPAKESKPMATKLKEVGRSISKGNAERIRAAADALLSLLGEEEKEEPGGETTATEAAKIPVGKGKIQSLKDVAAGLQTLMDYITNPTTKEQLEGDGDNDEDSSNVLLQTAIKDPVLESIRRRVDFAIEGASIALYERKFSTEKRNELAKSGNALPDGSYPIESADDLENAKRAFGRSNPEDRGKVKAHINKRAKALGEPALGEETKESLREAGTACAGCGEKVGRWDQFCSNCGEGLNSNKIVSAHCVGCGVGLPPDAKFCPECGNDVAASLDAQKELLKSEAAKESNGTSSNGKPNVASDTGAHMLKFAEASGLKQKNHLVKMHDADGDDDSLEAPAKRAAAHKAAHKVKESAVDLELDSEFIPLVEKAIGRDGTMQLKLIEPGWGSSGYYSKEVLKKDGPKAWPSGTKMYCNHPTTVEEKTRPERDLRDLAAVTTSDPVYLEEGPGGPGLYANAKPVTSYVPLLEELAPHIGVSIRAGAHGYKGAVEGRKGHIIEAIIPKPKGVLPNVIDFVTEPGAGGEILQLFESKRAQIVERIDRTLEDTDEVDELEVKETKKKLGEAEQTIKRLQERLVLRDARDLAEAEVARVENLPPITARRVVEMVSRDPATDDDGDLDKPAFRKQIKEAVQAESQYIQGLVKSGRPRGLGSERQVSESVDDDFENDSIFDDRPVRERGEDRFSKTLEDDFLSLGLDPKIAKEAAVGGRR